MDDYQKDASSFEEIVRYFRDKRSNQHDADFSDIKWGQWLKKKEHRMQRNML